MIERINTIDAFKSSINSGKVSLTGLLKGFIREAKKKNAEISSLIEIDERAILERVREVEGLSDKPCLWGLPIAVKDNICKKGVLTTCASKMLDGFRPPYNATVIDKLEENGSVLFSRANMDEFAFGSSCETSVYGPTKNPRDITRIPGGSSGGSAAAVASGQVVAAIGSDTGGSIRQPASMCGVVGMKPTYGRVSRYGLIAFASSLDQIGPLTNNIPDCAKILEVISGYDEKDSTSVDLPVPDFTSVLGEDIKGLRIGIPKEYFIDGIDAEVLTNVNKAIDILKKRGAEIKDISLPHTKYAVSCYYIIAPAEASSNLARYDGMHYGWRSRAKGGLIETYVSSRNEGFGEEAKRRILLGTYSLSSGYYEAYYLKALKVRTKIAEDFKNAFKDCDCIVTPTAPTTAFKIGEKTNDPLKMYLSDIFTIPANLAGIPAVSIPCGNDSKGLPVGLQLMAKPFDEEMLLRVGYAYERSNSNL